MASRSGNGQQTALSARFFQKLASGVPGVLFVYWVSSEGDSHRCPFISEHVQSLFGIDPADLSDNADPIFSMIHPEDVEAVMESIRASADTLSTWSYRARLRLENGGYEWFEVNAEPERQPDGGTLWYGQFHNIQHYKDLEQSLRESEAVALTCKSLAYRQAVPGAIEILMGRDMERKIAREVGRRVAGKVLRR